MVAIILVNYNGANDTIECIKSLSYIKDSEYEIVVVDNCSTDNSVEELKKIQENSLFTLLEAGCNNGFSAGNNIGIKYANNADYFLLLNNDTVVEPDFLKKLLDEFNRNPKCGATISKILYYSNPDVIWYAGGDFNKKTARSEHWKFNVKDDMTEINSQKVSFASGCCMCVSKKVIDEIGLLDEDFFLYEEDADFCYRIDEAGYEIFYVPESIIYHKVSASTGQGSPMSQFYTVRNKYTLIRKHFTGVNIVIAYTYCTLQFLFRCMKKEMNIKYYRLGLAAFWKHEVGKLRGGF